MANLYRPCIIRNSRTVLTTIPMPPGRGVMEKSRFFFLKRRGLFYFYSYADYNNPVRNVRKCSHLIPVPFPVYRSNVVRQYSCRQITFFTRNVYARTNRKRSQEEEWRLYRVFCVLVLAQTFENNSKTIINNYSFQWNVMLWKVYIEVDPSVCPSV